MAAKLVNAEEASVTPLNWRRQSRESTRPAIPRPEQSVQTAEEVRELRAQVLQLTASAEQAAREAHESGYRAGEQAARNASEAQMRACSENMARVIAEFAAARDESIRRAESDTVRLALEIARRVLHRELSVDSAAIEALVKAALEKLRNQEIYRVKVHPDQEQLIRTCLRQIGRGQEVEIVSDPTQSRGAALFEINRGCLDASVETQLREIERGLVDEMEIRA